MIPALVANGSKKKTYFAIAILILLVLLVFGQTLSFGYVNYDDDYYIRHNPHVEKWGTLEGVGWALTSMDWGDWQPMVWFSWMIDHALFGQNPIGYHLGNVVFHLLNVVLLFLVLKRMTGSFNCSWLVAAFFAVHPLRVESVAWIAERKDVLSSFFLLMTLWAYVRYTESAHRVRWYLIMLLMFVLGLMTKSMLVTLPFLMLLLDYWPLQRFNQSVGVRHASPLLLWNEKVPMFFLALVTCVITLTAIEFTKPFIPLEQVPYSLRFENALVSYGFYLGKLFYPSGLSFFYSMPESFDPSKVFISGLAAFSLLVISALNWKKRPYLLMGTLWFFLSLMPVIGFVRLGSLARADRYTYVAHIGLIIALVWFFAEHLPKAWLARRRIVTTVCFFLIGLYGTAAWSYTTRWESGTTLYEHALKHTPNNFQAYNNLGGYAFEQKNYQEAKKYFLKAIEIRPGFSLGHRNLGFSHLFLGEERKALEALKIAIKASPNDPLAHKGLGQLYQEFRQAKSAIKHFEISAQLEPGDAAVHYNLGNLYRVVKDLDRAVTHYQKAIEIRPDYASAHHNLANIFLMKGNHESALRAYQKAIQFNPEHESAANMIQKMTQSGTKPEERPLE